MKTKLTLKIATALLSLSTLNAQLSTCFAQGTAFTYQGRLNDGGNPANGIYDLRFTIYDANGGPTVVAGPVTNSPVNVSNGLFTVTLDFGAGVFTGPERWLEIDVRTNRGDAFTTLAPRQPVTAAPYALLAENISGVVASSSLPASPSFLGTVAAGGFAGGGAALTGLNASQLTTGTVPDARLAANLARTNQVWLLGGNAGTSPGTQFLGSTDNQPVEFKVNNRRVLRLEDNGGLTGSPNVIGGSPSNQVSSGVVGATIAGGGANSTGGFPKPNLVSADYGTVAGGLDNQVGGASSYATVGGGFGNWIELGSVASTIAGGQNNHIDADAGFATIAGGINHRIYDNSDDSTIGGGNGNLIQTATWGATLAGGVNNWIGVTADYSTVAGGRDHRLGDQANYATIGGGHTNRISAYAAYATVGGGHQNTAGEDWATVAGGFNNAANGWYATVGGGQGNLASGQSATVAGGSDNTASDWHAAVAGGRLNAATNQYAAVSGGWKNTAGGGLSIVGGGEDNTASDWHTVVAGGRLNAATNQYAAIGGGWKNTTGGGFSTVGGGGDNRATGYQATVAGGRTNVASGGSATIGGGEENRAEGTGATVGGGSANVATGSYTAVGGGIGNVGAGFLATIPGGQYNYATEYAFAAGQRAKANHSGAFVWADSQFADFASTAVNQFNIRAAGGVRLNEDTSLHFGSQTRQMLNLYGASYGIGIQNYTLYFRTDPIGGFSWFKGGVHSDNQNNPGTGGTEMMRLTSGGLTVNGTFVSSSDRNAKENFKPVDARAVLEKVAALPLSEWNYKTDTATRHLGPVAQDFHAAFGVGPDDQHIAMVDADGVALAAIQGLNQKMEEQRAELRRKQTEIAELKARLEKIETLLNQKPNGGDQ